MHKFIPMSQVVKIPNAEAAVEQECEKLENTLERQLTKVINKSEVIAGARNEGKTVHSVISGSKIREWNHNFKIQRSSSRTPR